MAEVETLFRQEVARLSPAQAPTYLPQQGWSLYGTAWPTTPDGLRRSFARSPTSSTAWRAM